jgi:hypothetical protein
MSRFAVVARLKPGAEARARALVEAGPPFDPAVLGVERHHVYLSYGEVVFLFEGAGIEWALDDEVDRPFRSPAFEAWKPLLDGPPRLAREVFAWKAPA